VAARLETIHDKIDDNQMRLEPETGHQEKMDAWILDMKDGLLRSNEATPKTMEPNPGEKEAVVEQQIPNEEATPEKMEPNPGEKEAVVEQQEIPNEEAAIHSLRAC
jgi:hypothetical protein